MVLRRTESNQYSTNSTFGKTINKFQDCDTEKNIYI